MISVTFENKGNWPFLLQVDVAGDGSNNQYQNEYIKMNTSK
jgi:hypothetical protein